jgi:hypothetical protein
VAQPRAPLAAPCHKRRFEKRGGSSGGRAGAEGNNEHAKQGRQQQKRPPEPGTTTVPPWVRAATPHISRGFLPFHRRLPTTQRRSGLTLGQSRGDPGSELSHPQASPPESIINIPNHQFIYNWVGGGRHRGNGDSRGTTSAAAAHAHRLHKRRHPGMASRAFTWVLHTPPSEERPPRSRRLPCHPAPRGLCWTRPI